VPVLDLFVDAPGKNRQQVRSSGTAQEWEVPMQKVMAWSAFSTMMFAFALGAYGGVIAAIG
jgi:hypothetical protein